MLAWSQSTMQPVPLAALITAVAGLPFAVWRIYLDVANIPPAMMVRPVGSWDWFAPITVLRALVLDRLTGNPILGSGAALFAMFMVLLVRRLPRYANRDLVPLFLITSCVIIVWLVFLAFAYGAIFAPEEVARAASAWRYLSQLGPIVLLALTAAFAGASIRLQTPSSQFPAAIVGALLLVAGEFVTWRYWHIDCRYADFAALHRIASSLAALGAVGDAPLTIVNPFEAAAYAIQLDYDLHRPSGRSRGVNDLSQSSTDGLILDLTRLVRVTAFSETSSARLLRRTMGELFPVAVVQAQPIGPSCHATWHL